LINIVAIIFFNQTYKKQSGLKYKTYVFYNKTEEMHKNK